MRTQLFILLFVFPLWMHAHSVPFAADDDNPAYGRRAWCLHGGYVQQDGMRGFEAGLGRINFITSSERGSRGLPLAGAAFTFGAEMNLGDTSLIVAPKLSIEGCAWIFGGRVSYGYYMQDGNRSGVISLEGGFCFLTYVSVYAGYNFVKGTQPDPVINEGTRLSIGINYPIGIRTIPAAKSPTHL